MKISTKGRYALRVMLDLAQHTGSDYVSVKDIAERQGISAKYLEQIISQLAKAKLLKSQRGNFGGYRLAKEPDAYSVGEILRTIEGSLAPVACLDDSPNQCQRCDECLVLPFWEGLDARIRDYTNSVTLADLLCKKL